MIIDFEPGKHLIPPRSTTLVVKLSGKEIWRQAVSYYQISNNEVSKVHKTVKVGQHGDTNT